MFGHRRSFVLTCVATDATAKGHLAGVRLISRHATNVATDSAAAVHLEEQGFAILLEKLNEQELTCTAGPSLSRFRSPAAGFELRIGSMAAPRTGAMDCHPGSA